MVCLGIFSLYFTNVIYIFLAYVKYIQRSFIIGIVLSRVNNFECLNVSSLRTEYSFLIYKGFNLNYKKTTTGL